MGSVKKELKKELKSFFLTLLVVCGIAAAGYEISAATRPVSTDTPIHAANVFADGFNHADFRLACETWLVGRRAGVNKCEQSLVQSIGLRFAAYGVPTGTYVITPHSQVIWTETINGKKFKFATVKVTYLGNHETMRLRRLNGSWYVWYNG